MAEPKPTRVLTSEVTVAECPVCTLDIVGEVTVEVWVSAVSLGPITSESSKAEVNVNSSSRVRSFKVEHACVPPSTVDPGPEDPEAH